MSVIFEYKVCVISILSALQTISFALTFKQTYSHNRNHSQFLGCEKGGLVFAGDGVGAKSITNARWYNITLQLFSK